MKLIDVLIESMSDGKSFDAFVGAAIAKKETQANEGLNLQKQNKSVSGDNTNEKKYDNGRTIKIGDLVIVNIDGNEFQSVVDEFRDEFVVVVDGDGDYWDVEPSELIHEDDYNE